MRTLKAAVWMVVWSALALAVGGVAAAPPRVVSATPDNGDVGVDPGLTELVITFDQAMSRGGMSIVGGGESFPKITGKARWRSTRTILVPIEFVPDHDYWLSINNERFTNFRSVGGEAAVPYPIKFSTGPGGGAEGGGADAPDFGPSVDRLIELMGTAYSHRERLGLDWADELEARRGALEACGSPGAFGRRLATVLARAQDKHLWVDAGTERFGTFVRPQVPNANPGLLPRLVEGFERRSPAVVSGRLAGGRVGYLAIDTWDRAQREDIAHAFDAIWAMGDVEALIVDVRLNGGGDESLAQEVAGCFVDDEVAYARHVVVDPKRPDGFSEAYTRVLEPSTRRPKFRGKVAVLTGPVCMSSNEAFVLMMRAGGAVTVGAATQGSSGNPRPYELGHGVTVYLPSWRAMTLDGVFFEGVGLPPDIRVDAGPRGFEDADPVLERAVEALLDG